MLRGDDEAFRLMYRNIQPKLVRYLTALVGPTDAEDVASDTWAQACRDLTSFSGDADGFRGWVTTIGRHRALDHLRARSRRPQSAGTIDEFPDRPANDDTEADVVALLSTAEALELIGSLPPEQAEAVLLRAVMGLDAKTAGRVLGRTAGAVRTASYRGLKALAKQAGAPASDRTALRAAEELR
ncbi:MAG: RNA polymerase sigma factor [Marmoricola sp.]